MAPGGFFCPDLQPISGSRVQKATQHILEIVMKTNSLVSKIGIAILAICATAVQASMVKTIHTVQVPAAATASIAAPVHNLSAG
jgi:hypothetical protein